MRDSIHLILVDDDVVFSTVIVQSLIRRGIDIKHLQSYGEAITSLSSETLPDAYIVELELGEKTVNGLDLCRRIKAFSETPVVMLTSDSSVESTVACLYAGAEQYVVKPCDIAELQARIEVAIRNSRRNGKEPAQRAKAEFHGLVIRLNCRKLEYGDKSASLTERELAVAEVFIANGGEELRRDYLFAMIFGKKADPFSRAVDIIVGRFRKKLKEVTEEIVVLPTRNSGYKLVSKDAE
jgi:DNA-binding response OmpR family regulator